MNDDKVDVPATEGEVAETISFLKSLRSRPTDFLVIIVRKLAYERDILQARVKQLEAKNEELSVDLLTEIKALRMMLQADVEFRKARIESLTSLLS